MTAARSLPLAVRGLSRRKPGANVLPPHLVGRDVAAAAVRAGAVCERDGRLGGQVSQGRVG